MKFLLSVIVLCSLMIKAQQRTLVLEKVMRKLSICRPVCYLFI